MITEGKWNDIGAEFPEEMPEMIRSTVNFPGTGIFTLAKSDKYPVIKDEDAIILIFPNPVFENGTVYLPEKMDVDLVNSSGITLLQENDASHLNLGGIPPGIYFIRNRKGQHARLVIIQN